MYKMFLDDERFPVDNEWVIVRSFDEAVLYIKEHGCPFYISFDHDLGDGLTGYDFAKWLIEQHLDNNIIPSNFSFYVHSMNPIGAANIKQLLTNFLKQSFP